MDWFVQLSPKVLLYLILKQGIEKDPKAKEELLKVIVNQNGLTFILYFNSISHTILFPNTHWL